MYTFKHLQRSMLMFALYGLSSFATAEQLLKTTTTWEGGDISYPAGDAQVTSIKLKVDETTDMPFHCHPVPTMGYIISGELEVETKGGKKTLLKAGESVVEVMHTIHRGIAIGGPVEVVVFYAGATDVPNTVLADSAASKQYCK